MDSDSDTENDSLLGSQEVSRSEGLVVEHNEEALRNRYTIDLGGRGPSSRSSSRLSRASVRLPASFSDAWGRPRWRKGMLFGAALFAVAIIVALAVGISIGVSKAQGGGPSEVQQQKDYEGYVQKQVKDGKLSVDKELFKGDASVPQKLEKLLRQPLALEGVQVSFDDQNVETLVKGKARLFGTDVPQAVIRLKDRTREGKGVQMSMSGRLPDNFSLNKLPVTSSALPNIRASNLSFTFSTQNDNSSVASGVRKLRDGNTGLDSSGFIELAGHLVEDLSLPPEVQTLWMFLKSFNGSSIVKNALGAFNGRLHTDFADLSFNMDGLEIDKNFEFMNFSLIFSPMTMALTARATVDAKVGDDRPRFLVEGTVSSKGVSLNGSLVEANSSTGVQPWKVELGQRSFVVKKASVNLGWVAATKKFSGQASGTIATDASADSLQATLTLRYEPPDNNVTAPTGNCSFSLELDIANIKLGHLLNSLLEDTGILSSIPLPTKALTDKLEQLELNNVSAVAQPMCKRFSLAGSMRGDIFGVPEGFSFGFGLQYTFHLPRLRDMLHNVTKFNPSFKWPSVSIKPNVNLSFLSVFDSIFFALPSNLTLPLSFHLPSFGGGGGGGNGIHLRPLLRSLFNKLSIDNPDLGSIHLSLPELHGFNITLFDGLLALSNASYSFDLNPPPMWNVSFHLPKWGFQFGLSMLSQSAFKLGNLVPSLPSSIGGIKFIMPSLALSSWSGGLVPSWKTPDIGDLWDKAMRSVLWRFPDGFSLGRGLNFFSQLKLSAEESLRGFRDALHGPDLVNLTGLLGLGNIDFAAAFPVDLEIASGFNLDEVQLEIHTQPPPNKPYFSLGGLFEAIISGFEPLSFLVTGSLFPANLIAFEAKTAQSWDLSIGNGNLTLVNAGIQFNITTSSSTSNVTSFAGFIYGELILSELVKIMVQLKLPAPDGCFYLTSIISTLPSYHVLAAENYHYYHPVSLVRRAKETPTAHLLLPSGEESRDNGDDKLDFGTLADTIVGKDNLPQVPIMDGLSTDIFTTTFKNLSIVVSPNCHSFQLDAKFSFSTIFGSDTSLSTKFFKHFAWDQVARQLWESSLKFNTTLGNISVSLPKVPGLTVSSLLKAINGSLYEFYHSNATYKGESLPELSLKYTFSLNFMDAFDQIAASLKNWTFPTPQTCFGTTEGSQACFDLKTLVTTLHDALAQHNSTAQTSKISSIGSWEYFLNIKLSESSWSLANIPHTPSFFSRFKLEVPTFLLSSLPSVSYDYVVPQIHFNKTVVLPRGLSFLANMDFQNSLFDQLDNIKALAPLPSQSTFFQAYLAEQFELIIDFPPNITLAKDVTLLTFHLAIRNFVPYFMINGSMLWVPSSSSDPDQFFKFSVNGTVAKDNITMSGQLDSSWKIADLEIKQVTFDLEWYRQTGKLHAQITGLLLLKDLPITVNVDIPAPDGCFQMLGVVAPNTTVTLGSLCESLGLDPASVNPALKTYILDTAFSEVRLMMEPTCGKFQFSAGLENALLGPAVFASDLRKIHTWRQASDALRSSLTLRSDWPTIKLGTTLQMPFARVMDLVLSSTSSIPNFNDTEFEFALKPVPILPSSPTFYSLFSAELFYDSMTIMEESNGGILSGKVETHLRGALSAGYQESWALLQYSSDTNSQLITAARSTSKIPGGGTFLSINDDQENVTYHLQHHADGQLYVQLVDETAVMMNTGEKQHSMLAMLDSLQHALANRTEFPTLPTIRLEDGTSLPLADVIAAIVSQATAYHPASPSSPSPFRVPLVQLPAKTWRYVLGLFPASTWNMGQFPDLPSAAYDGIHFEDAAFTLASSNLTFNPGSISPLAPNKDMKLQKGLNFYVAIMLDGSSPRLDGLRRMDSANDGAMIEIEAYLGSKFDWEFTGRIPNPIRVNEHLTINSALLTLRSAQPYFAFAGNATITFPLPDGKSKSLDVAVHGFLSNVTTFIEGSIRGHGQEPIFSIPIGAQDIEATEAGVSVNFTSPNSNTKYYDVTAYFTVELSKYLILNVSLEVDSHDGIILVSELVNQGHISLGQMIDNLAGENVLEKAPVPSFVSDILFEIELVDVELYIHITKVDPLFSAKAKLLIDGEPVEMGFFVVKAGGKWEVGLFIDIGSNSFDELSALSGTGFLPSHAGLIVTSLSNFTFLSTNNVMEEFRAYVRTLKEGANLVGSIDFSHGVMKQIGDMTGVQSLDMTINIAPTILPIKVYALFNLGELEVIPNFFYMNDVGLIAQISEDPAQNYFGLQVTATIQLSKQQPMVFRGEFLVTLIEFKGHLALLPPGVEDPFGLHGFHIVSGGLGMGVSWETMLPNSVDLDGHIILFETQSAELAISVNLVNIYNSGMLFKVENLDVGDLINKLVMPPGETWPEWLNLKCDYFFFSFNPGPQFTSYGITYPSGIQLDIRNLQFLFLPPFSALMRVSPTEAEFGLWLPKVEILPPLLELSGYEDTSRGPYVHFLFLMASPQDTVFDLDGAITFLGQKSHAAVHINSNNIYADIEVNWFFFQAILRCNLVQDQTTGAVQDWTFYGKLSLTFIKYLTEAIPAALEEIRLAATAKLRDARAEVNSWRSASDHLDRLIEQRKADINKGKEKVAQAVQGAVSKLQAAKAKVHSIDVELQKAKRDFNNHKKWYDWLSGRAEYYAAKVAVLWVAMHAAEAILDLAILVVEGFGALVDAFPVAWLDPEIWALELARGVVEGFVGLADVALLAVEGVVDAVLLVAEEVFKVLSGPFQILSIEVSGSMKDMTQGVLPSVTVELLVFGVHLKPQLQLDFRDVSTFAKSVLEFLISLFKPDGSSVKFLPHRATHTLPSLYF